MEPRLTIAVPRGKLFLPVAEMLAGAGIPIRPQDGTSRELAVRRDGWRLLIARPRDVGLYVEQGIAPLGVAGKDTLLELPREVVEALDLGVGHCRLVLAVPREAEGKPALSRVATKYPRLAEAFLHQVGSSAQVIQVHGSVELAAAIGLADAVVDLTQTGETLRQNGLVETAQIVVSSARLIANPVAYRIGRPEVREWIDRIREVTPNGSRS